MMLLAVILIFYKAMWKTPCRRFITSAIDMWDYVVSVFRSRFTTGVDGYTCASMEIVTM